MLRLLIFLLFLIASVWLGLLMLHHPGYLFLVFKPWMVQLPIWFAILLLLLLFILFYFIINGIDKCQWWWFRFKNWLHFRREQRSYSKTQEGLAALIEENWKLAEYDLNKGVSQTLEPCMNYLGAAYAAHKQKAYERRDQYIQQAYQASPDARTAIGLLQAQLELDQNQLEHAEATLNNLRQKTPRHPRVLKLLEKVYVRLGEWRNLLNLLPHLRKAKVVSAEDYVTFEKNIYAHLLHTTQVKNLDELDALWGEIPRNVKKNVDVLYAYVLQLHLFLQTSNVTPLERAESNNEIEQCIRKALQNSWQPELVSIYKQLSFTDLNQALLLAKSWLKTYGEKPEILLTLGELCMRLQLWGKAKNYFERSLKENNQAEAFLQYGKLLEQLEDKEAINIYRQGLTRLAELQKEEEKRKKHAALMLHEVK